MRAGRSVAHSPIARPFGRILLAGLLTGTAPAARFVSAQSPETAAPKVVSAQVQATVASRDASAQSPETAVFDHLSTEHGLSSHMITALLQDRQGFLWVGTFDGLGRYDGYGFETFKHAPDDPGSLPHDYVKIGALHEDRAGRLWVGTLRGLAVRNPATGSFETFRHDPGDPGSLSHDNISAIHEAPDGSIWVGTRSGLNRLDSGSGRITRFLHDPSDSASVGGSYISSLAGDALGRLWIGTEAGLDRLDPASGRFDHFRFLVGPSQVLCVLVDRRGAVWVGLAGDGVARLDPDTGRLVRYAPDPGSPDRLSGGFVWSLAEDEDGRIWVGTRTGGLNRLDPDTGHVVRYEPDTTLPESLSNAQVTALLFDREGVLWAGTWDGLNKRAPWKGFVAYPPRSGGLAREQLRVSSVYAVPRAPDELWVGTLDNGLFRLRAWRDASGSLRLDPIRQYRHNPEDPRSLGSDRVSSTWVDPDGGVWVGTMQGGLSRLEPSLTRFERYELDGAPERRSPSAIVNRVLRDHAGDLWVATGTSGLARRGPADDRFVTYRHDPEDSTSLSSDVIWTLLEDRRHRLWVGTLGGGLDRYVPEADAFERFALDPAGTDDPNHDRILSIREDADGMLWIGTMGGGLHRFDPDTGRVDAFNARDGLPHETVDCALADDSGYVWVATAAGLARLEPSARRVVRFTTSDGLPSETFQAEACHRAADGTFYFGTLRGLVAFRPEDIRIETVPPPVAFREIRVFNRVLPVDSILAAGSTITLPHDRNYLFFAFAALDYSNPARNRYRYRLEGVEVDWVEAGDRRFASYPALSPGRYVFRAIAANEEGVWNEAGASVRVVILPPFWVRWWFRMLAVVAVAGFGFTAHLYRVRQLLHVERTRRRIADDLHDDLGSRVATIAIQLDWLRHQVGFQPAEQRRLNYLLATTRQLANDLRDTIWIVYAENDHLTDLVGRMREVARHLLVGHTHAFSAPESLPDALLGMEVRRHLFLWFREAVHNAVRHAEAHRIDVDITFEHGRLAVTVSDDGRGFVAADVAARGLHTMRRRAEELGGEFTIDSRRWEGTVTRLSVDIKRRTNEQRLVPARPTVSAVTGDWSRKRKTRAR